MKTILYLLLVLLAIPFTACNSGGTKSEKEEHNMKKDNAQHESATNDKDVKAVAVVFSNVDTKASATIKEIVDHYLHIKNALASDNGGEAASGAKAMESAIGKLDKSLLTAEQKTVYDANETALKEHAGNVAKNGVTIKDQRAHFAMMSESVYDLVKNFGAGRPVYHDHCPMAKDNQGAMWISEIKEIKNPYFGSEMPKCGTVEEVIQ